MITLQKLLVCLGLCMAVGSGKDKDLKVVGIIKYVTDEALDNALNGIISKLEENGFKDGENIKIKDYNPEANASDLSIMGACGNMSILENLKLAICRGDKHTLKWGFKKLKRQY